MPRFQQRNGNVGVQRSVCVVVWRCVKQQQRRHNKRGVRRFFFGQTVKRVQRITGRIVMANTNRTSKNTENQRTALEQVGNQTMYPTTACCVREPWWGIK